MENFLLWQDYIFIRSPTQPGSAIWDGLHEAACISPMRAHHWTEMVAMLSSLDELLQLKFGLRQWKKITKCANNALLPLRTRNPCVLWKSQCAFLQKDGKLTSTPRGRDVPQNKAAANLTLSCTGDEQVKARSCPCKRPRRRISLICTWGLLFCSPGAKPGI